MRRRLLQGAAALVAGAAPSWLHAQPRAAHKIGYLHPRTVNNPTRSLLANAWRHLGYVEGDTVLSNVRRKDGVLQVRLWNPSPEHPANVRVAGEPVAIGPAKIATIEAR